MESRPHGHLGSIVVIVPCQRRLWRTFWKQKSRYKRYNTVTFLNPTTHYSINHYSPSFCRCRFECWGECWGHAFNIQHWQATRSKWAKDHVLLITLRHTSVTPPDIGWRWIAPTLHDLYHWKAVINAFKHPRIERLSIRGWVVIINTKYTTYIDTLQRMPYNLGSKHASSIHIILFENYYHYLSNEHG